MAVQSSRRVAASLLLTCVIIFACAWTSVFDKLIRIEYLALIPNGQGPMKENGPYTIRWIKVSYPEESNFKAGDVSMRHLDLDEGRELVGGWRGLDLGASGAMLTGRHHKRNLYVFINTGRAPVARGCCADSIRVFPSDGREHRDIVIVDIVRKAVNSIRGAHFEGISHAFHFCEVDGITLVLMPILFQDDSLDGVTIDGIIALNIERLTVHPTADGSPMFIPWRSVGTLNTSAAGTIFNIQYKKSGPSVFQQWHGNCIQTYKTSDGTNLLGVAFRMDVDAVLFKNPYLHTAADGGGMIMQRFGSPKIYNADLDIAGNHNFGIRLADSLPILPGDGTVRRKAYGGVHNLYFHKHADGRETVTVFVNQFHGHNQSGLFEFDIRLVQNHSLRPTDAVFATNYTFVPLPFVSLAQGGARPIGEGVYIASSGLADKGIVVVDTFGSVTKYDYSYKLLYDPFVFVTSTETLRSTLSISLLCVAAFIGWPSAVSLGSSLASGAQSGREVPYVQL